MASPLFDFERSGWRIYEQMDASRRLQGEFLDALGYGPRPMPAREVLRLPEVTLLRYGKPAGEGPILILVPAPIKRAYIFDLAPGASVARLCTEAGLRVYLVQWEPPSPGGPGPGLADYAERLLLACADAVRDETGEGRVGFAGHSFGGTLAAVFAALHPDRVRGLAVIASPLHFDFQEESGALGPLIGAVSRAKLLASAPGPVPGSFLSMMSLTASPSTFVRDRWDDWLASLPDAQALHLHLRVERWSMDEMPLSQRFVADVVGLLYGGDAFMRGNLEVAGRHAAAAAVRAPLLAVADPRCRIVPPAAIEPFYGAAGSPDKRFLWYQGDTGVAIQHVGMLVGPRALDTLWPEIIGWLRGLA